MKPDLEELEREISTIVKGIFKMSHYPQITREMMREYAQESKDAVHTKYSDRVIIAYEAMLTEAEKRIEQLEAISTSEAL